MESPGACHLVRDFVAHFANPVRLRILCALSDGSATVSELVELTEVRQSTVSQHLNLLRLGGIVSRTRDGSSMVYRLADPLAGQLMETIAAIAAVLVDRDDAKTRPPDC